MDMGIYLYHIKKECLEWNDARNFTHSAESSYEPGVTDQRPALTPNDILTSLVWVDEVFGQKNYLLYSSLALSQAGRPGVKTS